MKRLARKMLDATAALLMGIAYRIVSVEALQEWTAQLEAQDTSDSTWRISYLSRAGQQCTQVVSWADLERAVQAVYVTGSRIYGIEKITEGEVDDVTDRVFGKVPTRKGAAPS